VGEPFWDASIGKAALVVVVRFVRMTAYFWARWGPRFNLDVPDVLDELSRNQSRNLYLITEQGRVVATSAGNSAEAMKTTLPEATTRELIEREGQTVAQSRPQGREVLRCCGASAAALGSRRRNRRAPKRCAKAGVLRFRTVLLMTALLLGVGTAGVLRGVVRHRAARAPQRKAAAARGRW